MTDGILAAIRAEYAPYNKHPAFDEGFAAYSARPWENPYDLGTVKAQAWDRGLLAASRYARALDAAERGTVVERSRNGRR